jgi:signal peptidase I
VLISYRRLWVFIPLAVGAMLLSWTALFAVMSVEGGSMSPALSHGDKVLVFRWAYGLRIPGKNAPAVSWGKITKGHIVAVVLGSGGLAVKRVAAAPGDRITVAHGRLRSGSTTMILAENQSASLSGLTEIPPDQLLVIGDRGQDSYDSRHYGLVPVSALRGRILGAWHARSKSEPL